MTAATLFAGGVGILTLGWLWFYIVRPMLEGFGWIVNDNVDGVPVDMSSAEDSAPVESLSSKDGQNSGRTDSPQIGRAELLTLYKVLRKYGVPREEIRAALKGVRVPLSNDVWKAAAPAPVQLSDDDDVLVTPFAGRRTRASYYPDEPELEYQSPS